MRMLSQEYSVGDEGSLEILVEGERWMEGKVLDSCLFRSMDQDQSSSIELNRVSPEMIQMNRVNHVGSVESGNHMWRAKSQ